MKNYDAKKALAVILKAAKEYDKKLNNKHFLLVYRKKLPALTADTISGSGQSAFASLRTRGLRPLAPLKRLSLNITDTDFFSKKEGSSLGEIKRTACCRSG